MIVIINNVYSSKLHPQVLKLSHDPLNIGKIHHNKFNTFSIASVEEYKNDFHQYNVLSPQPSVSNCQELGPSTELPAKLALGVKEKYLEHRTLANSPNICAGDQSTLSKIKVASLLKGAERLDENRDSLFNLENYQSNYPKSESKKEKRNELKHCAGNIQGNQSREQFVRSSGYYHQSAMLTYEHHFNDCQELNCLLTRPPKNETAAAELVEIVNSGKEVIVKPVNHCSKLRTNDLDDNTKDSQPTQSRNDAQQIQSTEQTPPQYVSENKENVQEWCSQEQEYSKCSAHENDEQSQILTKCGPQSQEDSIKKSGGNSIGYIHDYEKQFEVSMSPLDDSMITTPPYSGDYVPCPDVLPSNSARPGDDDILTTLDAVVPNTLSPGSSLDHLPLTTITLNEVPHVLDAHHRLYFTESASQNNLNLYYPNDKLYTDSTIGDNRSSASNGYISETPTDSVQQ